MKMSKKFSPMALMSILVVCVVATTVLAGVIFSNAIDKRHHVIAESEVAHLEIYENWSGSMIVNQTYNMTYTITPYANTSCNIIIEITGITNDTQVNMTCDIGGIIYSCTESEVYNNVMNITIGQISMVYGEVITADIFITYHTVGDFTIKSYLVDAL